jgi:integrase
MAKQFTDRTIKALKPAEKGRRYDKMDHGNGSVAGLSVRVDEHGRKAFTLIKRYPGSTSPARRLLGVYPTLSLSDAREKASGWIKLIGKGIDPQRELEKQRVAEQRKQADTFGGLAEKFFSAKLKTQRRGHVVRRIISNELLPHWNRLPVAEISHRDVRELIEGVVERGADTYAHNVLDAAHALFSFAVARDVIDHNPCKQLKRRDLVGSKRHRERTLNDAELHALWRASGRLGYPFGPLYRLLLLTGARLDEAAGARWREFDLDKKLWVIPAERFKSETEHAVPLSAEACALLASLPRFRKGDHLFSTTFGESPVNGFSKAKSRLDSRMLRTLRALARQRGRDDAREIELTHFVNHDIRRTVRTRLSALKVQDHIAELVIGHGRKGLQRIYDQHRYLDEKCEALDKWANYLRSIIEPAPANVVTLAKARA